MPEKHGSFKPSQMREGGFLDGAEATLTKLRVTVDPYKSDEGVVAIGLTADYKVQTQEGDKIFPQFYPFGKPGTVTILNDGKSFEGEITSNTLGGKFLHELINAGFPEDKVAGPNGDDISHVDGTKVLLASYGYEAGGKGQKKQKSLPMPAKVLALPGETSAKTQAAGAAANSSDPEAQAGDDGKESVADVVSGYVLGVVNESEGAEIKKSALVQWAAKHFKQSSEERRREAVQLAGSKAFLEKIEGVSFDGTKLKAKS